LQKYIRFGVNGLGGIEWFRGLDKIFGGFGEIELQRCGGSVTAAGDCSYLCVCLSWPAGRGEQRTYRCEGILVEHGSQLLGVLVESDPEFAQNRHDFFCVARGYSSGAQLADSPFRNHKEFTPNTISISGVGNRFHTVQTVFFRIVKERKNGHLY